MKRRFQITIGSAAALLGLLAFPLVAAAEAEREPAAGEVKPYDHYRIIGQRNLFRAAKRQLKLKATAFKETATQDSAATKVSELDRLRSVRWVFTGFVAVGETRLAVLERKDEGEAKLLRPGDRLAGGRIQAIQNDRIILRVGEKVTDVKLGATIYDAARTRSEDDDKKDAGDDVKPNVEKTPKPSIRLRAVTKAAKNKPAHRPAKVRLRVGGNAVEVKPGLIIFDATRATPVDKAEKNDAAGAQVNAPQAAEQW